MKKKWLLTAASIGLSAVLMIPLMGFSTAAPGQTKISPNQITLESGGWGVPGGIEHEPKDGIISGALGCQPDIHEFDKARQGEHIVFTASVKEFKTEQDAAGLKDDFTIYVEIRSNGQSVAEYPFEYHHNPITNVDVDPNTNRPFWVSPVNNLAVFPTGEYNYQFKAKDKNGHVLDVWVPKNHKFTIIDSSVTN
jgi:hypothetical protein